MSRTGTSLASLSRGFRRLSLAGWAGLAVGSGAWLLAAAAWGARAGWFGQPAWVLATWAVFVLLVGTMAVLGVRGVRRLSAGWLAGQFESLGFRRGALSGHLEPAAAGTSPGLLALADERQASELAERAPDFIGRLRIPFRRRAYHGAAILLVGVLLLLSARPTSGRAALLWRPAEAWKATISPLAITVSEQEVERGALV
jgi:hypothetical protein